MNFIMRRRRYLLFLTLLIFLSVEIPIIIAGQKATPQASDVMIVLGARLFGREPSLILRLRLDTAAELYYRHYAPLIIVSGAQGKNEETSEAAAMKKYLVNKGIPGECIITEDQSYTTYQNLANSHAIMKERGLKKAVIVSNASHIRRALVLADYLAIDASGAAAPMPANLYLTVQQYLREGAAMLALAVTGH